MSILSREKKNTQHTTYFQEFAHHWKQEGLPSTLGELKRSGYRFRPVKDEMRENLIRHMAAEERQGQARLFPGIVGFENTVIPQIENAILSKHDFMLLGLRGQAKSRILRYLPTFLDEQIPSVEGGPLNDSPVEPVSRQARRILREKGDETPIRWIPRDERYTEKLATPDVSIADLIGDLDPIKAMAEKRSFADEEAIHYGLVPRANRGIFAINELPDLQLRIQVGLLNIMEEKDIQIRGFPVRLPLDVVLVFTANPEDYTNRGSIITPLKDRIDAQILTHYPRSIQESMAITTQEAWCRRGDDVKIIIPDYYREVVEQIAFEARASDFVDQNSGVSARMTISIFETLNSAIEKRIRRTGEGTGVARVADLYACLPAIMGKIELVYKGEQEGVQSVGRYLIGASIKTLFSRFFPGLRKSNSRESFTKIDVTLFKDILGWFAQGKRLDITDEQTFAEYAESLRQVTGLEKAARENLKVQDPHLLPAAMEFVLEGLYLNAAITKKTMDGEVVYVDALMDMFHDNDEGTGPGEV